MTYVTPIFRYGSLVYMTEKELNSNWDRWGKTNTNFIRKYNSTVKLMFKLPKRTGNFILENLLGPFSA